MMPGSKEIAWEHPPDGTKSHDSGGAPWMMKADLLTFLLESRLRGEVAAFLVGGLLSH
jgi:hypothetical protein